MNPLRSERVAHRHHGLEPGRDLAVYERLAHALNKHPEGFPRTQTGVELQILMRILSPEEAELGSHLTHNLETAEAIGKRMGVPEAELERRLLAMMAQGKVWRRKSEQAGKWAYRMAPFIPGFYEEYMVETRDMELLHLMGHYAREGALEIMTPTPALQRVIPALRSVAPEEILPYDDVKEAILAAKAYALFDCTCRVTRDMMGNRPCRFPTRNCLQLYYEETVPGPNMITRERALEVLDEAEAVGLVHTGTNYVNQMHWICNCCGCCCNLIRNLIEEGLEGAIAKANYYAEAAAGRCSACATCVERCPVKAIALREAVLTIDRSQCIGCGLCITGCPSDALALKRRTQGRFEAPPRDEEDFNRQRLRNRGLL
jgi:Na+-translocating ferredoxin:NAD+ oxidoreductase subunit B